MAWIELHQQLPSHPKTKRLTRALGLTVPQDIPQTVGHLCMMWLWCVDYAVDGSLEGMSAQDIADAAGWTGDQDCFMEAMRQAGFIDTHEDGTDVVHDWDDYIGRLLAYRDKERKRNAEKQRRHRERIKKQKENEKEEDDPEEIEPFDSDNPTIDQGWLKVVKCYEHNIGLIPNGISGEMLVSFYDDLGADVTCKAIEVTNKANPGNPWKYLQSILNKWAEMQIDTPEKADAYNKDLERRIENLKKRKPGFGTGSPEDGGPPAISGGFY